MSEYQCYEFRAIDRALSLADKQEIRSISTLAQLTDLGFVNHDEIGDVTGAPWEFMARWFDLQLSIANWGTERLMIPCPGKAFRRTCSIVSSWASTRSNTAPPATILSSRSPGRTNGSRTTAG